MATIPGIGIDLIEVERIEGALERRPRLAERLFTQAELDYSGARARPGRHLAARFAAKEAALKALGLGGMRMGQVEVIGGGDGPPALRLSGDAAEVAEREGVTLAVSLTHSRELAAAAVTTVPLTCEAERSEAEARRC
jgi:holo-[acyl-carrier protein] synthase